MFIIIVFRWGSVLSSSAVYSTVFPKGSVKGCDVTPRVGGWFFILDCSSPFCFLLIEFHYTFFYLLFRLTCYVYYYCIW